MPDWIDIQINARYWQHVWIYGGVGLIGVPVMATVIRGTYRQAWKSCWFGIGVVGNAFVEIWQGMAHHWDAGNFADPVEWLVGLVVCFLVGGIWLKI